MKEVYPKPTSLRKLRFAYSCVVVLQDPKYLDKPSANMPKDNSHRLGIYTVICRWLAFGEPKDSWRFIAVAIGGMADAQDAANNACLYLIWKQQGQVEPCFVIPGMPKLFIPDVGNFDAEWYGDVITFAGAVLAHNELEPRSMIN